MNILKNLILVGFTFLHALPVFSLEASSFEKESALTVKSSFSINGEYYVCLNDGSCFALNKILICKRSGWFSTDKYGNPAANWLVGDPVNIERTGEYDLPFNIVNLCTKQSALARSFNFEVRHYERMHDGLRDLLYVLKEIQNDISVIKYDIKNLKQEGFFKSANAAP